MLFFFVCLFVFYTLCSGSYILIGTIPLNPDFLFRVLSHGFGAFFLSKQIWKPEV